MGADSHGAQASESRPRSGWLLVVALFGLLVPNGLFIAWMLRDFHGIGPVLQDRLALGFMLDALMVVAILAVEFARHPIGHVRWPVFVLLSLIGGLGFGLPLYGWLNRRRSPREPRPTERSRDGSPRTTTG